MLLCVGGASARQQASLLIEARTGKVLEASASETPVHPASLTKMMTLYLLFEAMERGRLTPWSRLAVSANAEAQPRMKLGLGQGTTITVDAAIKALVTRSANDVATVVAEAIGGTEDRFAQIMTTRARQLGMHRTTFRNASGLPDERQVTTARDTATLVMALLYHYPKYFPYFNTRSFEHDGKSYSTHNHVLESYPGADGLKTGYIRASGYNLASTAVRNGTRLIGIVFGGDSSSARDQQMREMLDRGFAAVTGGGGPAVAARDDGETGVVRASVGGRVATRPAQEPSAPQAGPGFAIQVGVFSNQAAAMQTATQARHMLGGGGRGARVEILPMRAAEGTLYRARLTGLTRASATVACATLKAERRGCLVVFDTSQARAG